MLADAPSAGEEGTPPETQGSRAVDVVRLLGAVLEDSPANRQSMAQILGAGRKAICPGVNSMPGPAGHRVRVEWLMLLHKRSLPGSQLACPPHVGAHGRWLRHPDNAGHIACMELRYGCELHGSACLSLDVLGRAFWYAWPGVALVAHLLSHRHARHLSVELLQALQALMHAVSAPSDVPVHHSFVCLWGLTFLYKGILECKTHKYLLQPGAGLFVCLFVSPFGKPLMWRQVAPSEALRSAVLQRLLLNLRLWAAAPLPVQRVFQGLLLKLAKVGLFWPTQWCMHSKLPVQMLSEPADRNEGNLHRATEQQITCTISRAFL